MSSSDKPNPNEGDASLNEEKCLCCKNNLQLLRNSVARVKELEEELKEAKRNNSQLCETVRTLTGLISKKTEEKATGHESQPPKLEEFMEKMEERAERQEEMVAVMKETMNRDREMLKKQLDVLQKAVEDSEDKEKEIGRSVKELTINMTKKFSKQDEDLKKLNENLKKTEKAMQLMKEEAIEETVDARKNTNDGKPKTSNKIQCEKKKENTEDEKEPTTEEPAENIRKYSFNEGMIQSMTVTVSGKDLKVLIARRSKMEKNPEEIWKWMGKFNEREGGYKCPRKEKCSNLSTPLIKNFSGEQLKAFIEKKHFSCLTSILLGRKAVKH